MGHPLFVADTDGGYREATADEVIEAARAALSRRCRRGESFASPAKTKQYLSLKLGDLPYETFVVMFLDKRHRLIQYAEMFRGTIDSASVYPREVVKEAWRSMRPRSYSRIRTPAESPLPRAPMRS